MCGQKIGHDKKNYLEGRFLFSEANVETSFVALSKWYEIGNIALLLHFTLKL